MIKTISPHLLKHPLVPTWRSMHTRCNKRNALQYRNWAGRGIKVCERWFSFDAFLEDMGEKPAPEYSIDRIDNDGNYEPSNCRWATKLQQARNRTKKKYKKFIFQDYENEIRRNPPPVMTVVETSMFLNVSDRKVREMIKQGVIPHKRVGVQIRIRLKDVNAYLENGGAK